MADKVMIVPAVLKWARETSGLPEIDAATETGIAEAKLREWEEGLDQPSIDEMKILAAAYQQPLAAFFLPNVPKQDSELTATIYGECCLNRTAKAGGKVKLVIDEDLITFSYLPIPRNPSQRILEFYQPSELDKEAFLNLFRRFFEL